MIEFRKIIFFSTFPIILSSCGASIKSCEQDEFVSVIIGQDIFQGGLKNFNMTNAKVEDVIELKMDEKSAICSGTLTATQNIKANSIVSEDQQAPFKSDYTWKVEETQDGKNFFSWVDGRQSAADME